MADGCKIQMNGLDTVMKNLKEFTPKLKAALLLDAQVIAAEMEIWSKDNAAWTDQTTHARQFLKATVKWTNTNTLMVALSHGVDYGIYLELANEGKYAILERSIQEFAPKFIEDWKKIIQETKVI
mgnify:CR=1 FL=1